MSLTAFRPYSSLGDVTTSTSTAFAAVPAGSACVLLTASVDTWASFGLGNASPAAGAAGTVYIPAKVPCLFSLDPAVTSIGLIAGGAGKCNVAFGAQA